MSVDREGVKVEVSSRVSRDTAGDEEAHTHTTLTAHIKHTWRLEKAERIQFQQQKTRIDREKIEVVCVCVWLYKNVLPGAIADAC